VLRARPNLVRAEVRALTLTWRQPRRAVKLEGAPTYNGQPLTKRAKRQVGFVLQVRPAAGATRAGPLPGQQGWGCHGAPGAGGSVRAPRRHRAPGLSFVDLGWRGRGSPGSRDARRTPRPTLPPRVPEASAAGDIFTPGLG
jgi:hypothetical protein